MQEENNGFTNKTQADKDDGDKTQTENKDGRNNTKTGNKDDREETKTENKSTVNKTWTGNRNDRNETQAGNQDLVHQILESIDQSSEGEKVAVENVVFYFKNFNSSHINNHGGIVAGDNSTIENIQFHAANEETEPNREDILSDERRFNDWLSNNYESYSMALLAAVAVFDALPYTWVIRATETLYQRFRPKKEEEERTYGLTETLGQFGAVLCQGELNTYAGKIPIKVVKLSKKEYQETILTYLWQECPKMHDDIMQWLEDYIFQDQMSMSKRAAEIMGRLISWDYYYFLDHMVKRIPQENCLSTDMIIAQNVLILSRESIYEKNVHHLLHCWSMENNIHYLLTALLVCTELRDGQEILLNTITTYVDRAIQEINGQMYGMYMRHIKAFYASGVRSFTFYRILIEQIDRHLTSYFRGSQKNVCRLFIGLFAADLKLTQFTDGEDAIFIKLCMTDQNVSDRLCRIWQSVWQFRQYRKTFYDMLAKYERKSCKDNGTRLETFIRRVFGDICTIDTQHDICRKIHRRAGYE